MIKLDSPQQPTSFLPLLQQLSSQTTQDIVDAIHKLRSLYGPPTTIPLLSSRLTIRKQTLDTPFDPDSGYASASGSDRNDSKEPTTTEDSASDTESIEYLPTDPLERGYAIKWLTGFIVRFDTWIVLSSSQRDRDARIQMLDEASEIFAALCATPLDPHRDHRDEEGDGAMARSFEFPFHDGSVIKVQINDALPVDSDHTSVGLQSWGSSIRLGQMLCAAPANFFFIPQTKKRMESGRPLRIVELGAGTGLLSILTANILLSSKGSRHDNDDVEIVATDYHPNVLKNLKANISANFQQMTTQSVGVHFLDWESPVLESGPLCSRFDVVLAADVTYAPGQGRWIKACVERLLVRPDEENPRGGVFWLMVPLRRDGRHEGVEDVREIFFDGGVEGSEGGGGCRLVVLSVEVVEKVKGIGRADEHGYKLFRIGWVPTRKK